MMFDNLTVKNAALYAAKHYENPQCIDPQEYEDDFRHFKYVKRLCRRYLTTARLRERLLLNHLVLLFNVFGDEATVRLLFVKCDDPRLYRVLKTFLVYMERCPDEIPGIDGEDIYLGSIPTDRKLLERLQAL